MQTQLRDMNRETVTSAPMRGAAPEIVRQRTTRTTLYLNDSDSVPRDHKRNHQYSDLPEGEGAHGLIHRAPSTKPETTQSVYTNRAGRIGEE